MRSCVRAVQRLLALSGYRRLSPDKTLLNQEIRQNARLFWFFVHANTGQALVDNAQKDGLMLLIMCTAPDVGQRCEACE